MRTLTLCALLAWLAIPIAGAGTIVGVVQSKGATSGADGAGGKYDSRKFKFVERVDYESLHDFVVFIEGAVGTNAAPVPLRAPVDGAGTKPRSVSQKNAMFAPHVLPVVVGTRVEWPNEDEIFHNVFSISEPKEFDFGLYKKPDVKDVTFDKPGRVDVFCSIHSAMNCVVLVLDNPFFAATDEKGRYTIPNVPAGTYQLKAWHERLPGKRQTITVPESGEVRADFVLGPGEPQRK